MARMIDADVVTSILEEWEEKACDGTENDGSDGTTRVLHPVPTTTREMIDLIADQPTIEAEPVKHGRWIVKNGRIVCDQCEALWAVCPNKDVQEEEMKMVYKTEKFCYNCGAKMQGGNDHD